MYNNCIKINSGKSAPGNNGQWITIQDGFRVYDSWEGSINNHSKFLTENERYARAGFFVRCAELDYVGTAQALKAAEYDTDPKYASSLIDINNQYGLDEYDKEAVRKMQAINDFQNELAALKAQLQKSSAPDWFIKEFGTDEITEYIKDITGDVNFWRNFAETLRVFTRKNL
jgi:hypothetical protein